MKNKNLLIYLSVFSIIIALSIIMISALINNKGSNNNDNDDNNNGSSYLKSLTYNEFTQLIDDKESFILLIAATDCPHCKAFKPKLTEILEEYKVNANYIYIDTLTKDNQKAFYQIIQYNGIPTTVFINNGVEESSVNRIVGNQSKSKIIDKLKDNDYVK